MIMQLFLGASSLLAWGLFAKTGGILLAFIALLTVGSLAGYYSVGKFLYFYMGSILCGGMAILVAVQMGVMFDAPLLTILFCLFLTLIGAAGYSMGRSIRNMVIPPNG